ncbi:MAG: hypothetical protein ACYDDI_14520 [Candidatus Acidiferrales bacterium]
MARPSRNPTRTGEENRVAESSSNPTCTGGENYVADGSSNPTGAGGAYAKKDLVSTQWSCAIWCACGAAFVAGFSAERWRPVLWIAGLGVAGALCVANAVRCRRRHCYITGPVFLTGALLSALDAAGVTRIPWMKLGWGVVIGAAAGMIIEALSGKYGRGGDAKGR